MPHPHKSTHTSHSAHSHRIHAKHKAHKIRKTHVTHHPVLKHGHTHIRVPTLSGPVGKVTPNVLLKYPKMNAPADVLKVDYYITALKKIKFLKDKPSLSNQWCSAKASTSAIALLQLCNVDTWTNRNIAIADFQKKLKIHDAEEVTNGIVKPDGETWIAMVDYGDLVEKLLAAAYPPVPLAPKNYIYNKFFDSKKFKTNYINIFSKSPRYNPAAIPNMMKLLGLMERDNTIIDIRWMAYMLATAFWETTSLVTKKYTVLKKNGKPLLNKHGKPVIHKRRSWKVTMAPIEEFGHGKGRNYYLPVKVEKQKDGTAIVTEEDGERFAVKLNGKYSALTKGAAPGAPSSTAATKTYLSSTGTQHSYFGRGYVQLTWWNHYASAGHMIGKGLDLLFDPDKVKDPAIAYSIMSTGMRTGAGFANKKRFAHYFYGTHTDYVGARHMVNGIDHRHDIAKIAEDFEKILMSSRQ